MTLAQIIFIPYNKAKMSVVNHPTSNTSRRKIGRKALQRLLSETERAKGGKKREALRRFIAALKGFPEDIPPGGGAAPGLPKLLQFGMLKIKDADLAGAVKIANGEVEGPRKTAQPLLKELLEELSNRAASVWWLALIGSLDYEQLSRLAKCPVCEHFFIRGRRDQPACSKKCANTLRVRRWREHYKNYPSKQSYQHRRYQRDERIAEGSKKAAPRQSSKPSSG